MEPRCTYAWIVQRTHSSFRVPVVLGENWPSGPQGGAEKVPQSSALRTVAQTHTALMVPGTLSEEVDSGSWIVNMSSSWKIWNLSNTELYAGEKWLWKCKEDTDHLAWDSYLILSSFGCFYSENIEYEQCLWSSWIYQSQGFLGEQTEHRDLLLLRFTLYQIFSPHAAEMSPGTFSNSEPGPKGGTEGLYFKKCMSLLC